MRQQRAAACAWRPAAACLPHALTWAATVGAAAAARQEQTCCWPMGMAALHTWSRFQQLTSCQVGGMPLLLAGLSGWVGGVEAAVQEGSTCLGQQS